MVSINIHVKETVSVLHAYYMELWLVTVVDASVWNIRGQAAYGNQVILRQAV